MNRHNNLVTPAKAGVQLTFPLAESVDGSLPSQG